MDLLLLALLREGLKNRENDGKANETDAFDGFSHQERELADTCDWTALVQRAGKHNVLPLIYDTMERFPIPQTVLEWSKRQSQILVRQNYRLLILSSRLLAKMQERGIPVVLLKGMGTASFYPVPELRKSGDIDFLLLDSEKLEEAGNCLLEFGAREEETQLAHHHVVFGLPMEQNVKIEIELHTMLAEPFDQARVNQLLNRQLADCKCHVTETEVAGFPLRILDIPYHGYELLLHMLQHFLRSGFGLKLLCDWTVFWGRETTEEEQNTYLQLVCDCGIKKFSDIVTLCCVEYLGLQKQYVEFMNPDETLSPAEFMQEIIEAEEFGKASKDRMVALRGNHFWDYVREFHHQMHLNYPRLGRIFILWPILWGITLLRFLWNNHRIRKTSLAAILRKAGQRGKIIKSLRLFR